MQCEQLQQRLNELLDRREDVRSDDEVEAHRATCPSCDRLVGAYESMLLGVELLGEAELEDQFVRRTVDTADRRLRRARTLRRVLAAGALAAAVLVAASVAPWSEREGVPRDIQGSVAFDAAVDEGRSGAGLRPDSPAVAKVLQATGRNLAALPATFPETMRRVAAHPTTDQIVGPMRPLAEPVGATWEVLLRACSGGPAPAAAIPEADTGYVLLRFGQHA